MPFTRSAQLGLALATVLCAASATAQAPTMLVRGSVYDSTGAPLENAEIIVLGSSLAATTTTEGVFSVASVPRGTTVLRFRRLGFQARTLIVEPGDTIDLAIELRPLVARLSPVVVKGAEEQYAAKMAGFAERMRDGARSSFVTRADIERQRPFRVSDLLQLRATSRCRAGRGAVFVDGISAPGFDVDRLSPHDIEAIEIYRGPAQIPAQFNVMMPNGSKPGCVTVVWTR